MITETFTSTISGNHSPSSLTTHLFKLRGHHIDTVERTAGKIKKDLWGFADHVAMSKKPSDGVLKFLQSTSFSNRTSRIKKIATCPEAKLLHEKGHDVAVVTWLKRKRFVKRKDGTESVRFTYQYRGQIDTFEADDFKEASDAV